MRNSDPKLPKESILNILIGYRQESSVPHQSYSPWDRLSILTAWQATSSRVEEPRDSQVETWHLWWPVLESSSPSLLPLIRSKSRNPAHTHRAPSFGGRGSKAFVDIFLNHAGIEFQGTQLSEGNTCICSYEPSIFNLVLQALCRNYEGKWRSF